MITFQKWSKWRKIESDYWQTTYRELNPFMPPIVCPHCDEKPVKERWRDAEDGIPVSEFQFECSNKHRWETRKTYD